MKVQHSISVQYKSTSDAAEAKLWLDSLPDTFAADFETAVRYSEESIEQAKQLMVDPEVPRKTQIYYQAIANASALGHPSHCTITHCSIAYSDRDAYVFIIDHEAIAEVVLDFLVTTDKKQIWHNYSYDGRFLRYYAGTDAKNVEDTQIFAKTLVNHVEVNKASVGLKTLMQNHYGDWGISAENFTIGQQYDEKVIKYAAIDACATYKLWEDLNDYVKNNS